MPVILRKSRSGAFERVLEDGTIETFMLEEPELDGDANHAAPAALEAERSPSLSH